MLLARQGQRVLLLDRARLPSETAQGHFVYRHGPRRLQQWGLLDRIIDSGSPPVTSLTMDVGDFPLVARARLTIGADGRNSRIAQAVHAPMYEQIMSPASNAA